MEPQANRTDYIPFGKTIRIINLATNRPMIALKHGIMHDTGANDTSMQSKFRVTDRGNGKVSLQCADGRYVRISGIGMPGDIRFTTNPEEAEVFMWQDYLNKEFMLMSFNRHLYMGMSPTTGSSYSLDYHGSDPARQNGAVFRWELAE